MDPISQQAFVAAGAAGGAGDSLYADDLFSTFIWEGNGSARSINNGIDLSGEGGLVWIKNRNDTSHHHLYDTERGIGKRLRSSGTNQEDNYASSAPTSSLTAFNSNGFSIGTFNGVNGSGNSIVSWTFRKAPKFFDVVTYTGNGTTGRTVSHNLGSVPGMMIVKKRDGTGNWAVYHRAEGNGYAFYLHTATGRFSTDYWNDTTPTSTYFTLNNGGDVNANGSEYVAYLFAHDEESFGANGDESIIKCGDYVGNSQGLNTINLGWEPQFVLVKKATDSGSQTNWWLGDVMRGLNVHRDEFLFPNTNATESGGWNFINPTPTGFEVTTSDENLNAQFTKYLYLAVRRDHKTPTASTEVFDVVSRNSANPNLFSTALKYVDTAWNKVTQNSGSWVVSNRLQGERWLKFESTGSENTGNPPVAYDYNYQIMPYWWNYGNTEINYLFRRAPGFYDVVFYTATGSIQTVPHGLGVVPEMIIVKSRSSSYSWGVYHTGMPSSSSQAMLIESTAALFSSTIFNQQAPTASNFYVNYTSGGYLAFLYATVAGVSKVGSYTGTGYAVNVDCGFTNGARFVMIKRSDSSGGWYVWDSARGIVSGNDPYVRMNSNAAQVTNTDYIDPLSAGFTVSSSAPSGINANGGNYIFLAIA